MVAEGRSNRRSDEIRRRRMSQSHAAWKSPIPTTGRPKRTARRPVNTVTHKPPPVVTRKPISGYDRRSDAASMNAGRRGLTGKRSSRRMYNVSLSAQGAEMSLPSLPAIRVSWRLASLSILALMVVALYYLWTSPIYRVEAAEISGLRRLRSGDVNKALAIAGKPVFALDANQLQEQLMYAFPEFSAAAVQVELPSSVIITVTERVPVLTWKHDGHSDLVDAQGITFPVRDGIPASALPTVEADEYPPEGFVSGTLITSTVPGDDILKNKALADLADKLPAELIPIAIPAQSQAKALLSPEMVSGVLYLVKQAPTGAQVTYSAAHGFGWKDTRGWNVYFGQVLSAGDYHTLPAKLEVYRAIIEQLKEAGSRPTLISVEYLYAPYYRVEDEE
jgi:hypothetical protein